ncbi:glycoside hydrolase family 25 protein [Klebsiella sp. RHBSTW-00484]|uniref:glycoside hydrolase family 25 protein n=1 Tax=unclassified Klebsiella TaxID=2608929 RepID=UPI0015E4F1DE|nr:MULTISPECIES: GH25 family lysozyme [unclassified Klebsiella]MBA7843735.1 glycoside hydrolase family 25 protein [Klebsiella sp. RHBSTW-00465]QLO39088.1 glycoside hydrolase family 25 protein [Klebsiella sp. RHBSTW-00484]QLT78608.1 glycoside hydrolase family 25 protein [Klebsiella sp. RHBSTW-00464]
MFTQGRKIIWLLLALTLFAGLTRIAFYEGWLRFNYPSRQTFPIQGIDVSHHQQAIDWAQLKKQNIQFAFIKATEGESFKDSAFDANWRNARKQGIITGAYHFFTFCKSGIAQAGNFIATVPVSPHALPPVLDLEYGGNCMPQSHQQIVAEVRAMTAMLETVYQQKVILYATREFYDDHLQNEFSDNPLWIRDIWRQPRLESSRQWVFWQFANRGRLAGIDAFVDLNVFQGSDKQFTALLHP